MAKAKCGISKARTVFTFINGRACSDTIFNVINREFGQPLKTEEQAVMPLAGGIMQHGYQCGMIWGATLAAGAQAYRLHGPGPLAETKAIMAAQRIVEAFRDLTGEINCLEITDIDNRSSVMKMIYVYLIKGKTIGCIRTTARYAPLAYDAINSAFAETDLEVPPAPVSCAAMLAKKVGASDMQATMAAGLAGGIGLCGGACGALGAAIWIFGMSCKKIKYKHPSAMDVIDRFLKCTNYKFECSEIVGRKFENVGDHAGYLRDGGCAEIIDALAKSK